MSDDPADLGYPVALLVSAAALYWFFLRERKDAGTRVWLRGLGAWSGVWRAGRFDRDTGEWKPRLPGTGSVRLVDAGVLTVRPATQEVALSEFFSFDTVLTCVDAAGRPFQVAVDGTDDAALIKRRLGRATHRHAAGQVDRMAKRRRTPVVALALLCAGLLAAGYFLLPLLNARQVEGSVLHNTGETYLCDVGWYDPARDVGRLGKANCGHRQPGEQLPVTLLGWPRTDTIDDPRMAVIAGVLAGGVPAMTGLVLLLLARRDRRRFTQRAATRFSH